MNSAMSRVFVIVCFLAQSFVKIYSQIPARQITLDLNPIVVEGGRYYFNGQRLSFDGLIIPLRAVDDREVNRHIKTVYTVRTSQTLVSVGIAAYLIHLVSQDPTYDKYQLGRALMITSLAASVSLNIAEGLFKRKAIKRFNNIVTSGN